MSTSLNNFRYRIVTYFFIIYLDGLFLCTRAEVNIESRMLVCDSG